MTTVVRMSVEKIIASPVVEAAWEVEYTSARGNGWGRMDQTIVQVNGQKYLLTAAYDIAGSGTAALEAYGLPNGVMPNWDADSRTSVTATPKQWEESGSEWKIRTTKIK